MPIMKGGKPMMGGFTAGEVAKGYWIIWAPLDELDVVVDVEESFGGVLPGCFTSWVVQELLKGWEVEAVQKLAPQWVATWHVR